MRTTGTEFHGEDKFAEDVKGIPTRILIAIRNSGD